MKTNLAMTNDSIDTIKHNVSSFLTGYSIEVTPGGADKIESFADLIPVGKTVAVTFLPGSDYRDTVRVAKRLRDEGYEPAPHVCARSMKSEAEFRDYISRLSGEAGAHHAVVLAGGVTNPLGPYSDSMQLLRTGIFEEQGFKHIGVAGHPEGTPDISDQELARALQEKNEYAKQSSADFYIATQFVFEAAPVIEWDKRISQHGNELPIHIGLPGLATIKTLLAHAKACGVGPSMRFLSRQAANITKLMTVSSPDRLVMDLAAYKANDPECNITQAHMYPLGGMRRTAEWTSRVQSGEYDLNKKGDGFKLYTPVA